MIDDLTMWTFIRNAQTSKTRVYVQSPARRNKVKGDFRNRLRNAFMFSPSRFPCTEPLLLGMMIWCKETDTDNMCLLCFCLLNWVLEYRLLSLVLARAWIPHLHHVISPKKVIYTLDASILHWKFQVRVTDPVLLTSCANHVHDFWERVNSLRHRDREYMRSGI